jgi:thioredoxin-dependent peroxiredoxin
MSRTPDLGITRTTFLIDRDGIVRQVYRQIRVEEHEEEVLAALRASCRANALE